MGDSGSVLHALTAVQLEPLVILNAPSWSSPLSLRIPHHFLRTFFYALFLNIGAVQELWQAGPSSRDSAVYFWAVSSTIKASAAT